MLAVQVRGSHLIDDDHQWSFLTRSVGSFPGAGDARTLRAENPGFAIRRDVIDIELQVKDLGGVGEQDVRVEYEVSGSGGARGRVARLRRRSRAVR